MTSGGLQGMDTEYARNAAHSMDGGVSAIQGMTSRIGQLLDHVVFQGEFASGFKSDWHGTFTPQLNGANNALSDNAQVLRRRAQMQDEASGT